MTEANGIAISRGLSRPHCFRNMVGLDSLLDGFGKGWAPAEHHEPGETDREVSQKDVREDVHRPGWHRINTPDGRHHQENDRGHRDCDFARLEPAPLL